MPKITNAVHIRCIAFSFLLVPDLIIATTAALSLCHLTVFPFHLLSHIDTAINTGSLNYSGHCSWNHFSPHMNAPKPQLPEVYDVITVMVWCIRLEPSTTCGFFIANIILDLTDFLKHCHTGTPLEIHSSAMSLCTDKNTSGPGVLVIAYPMPATPADSPQSDRPPAVLLGRVAFSSLASPAASCRNMPGFFVINITNGITCTISFVLLL